MNTFILSFLSQKGGAGKSTGARTFAVELAKDSTGSVLLADLDNQQATCVDWGTRRNLAGFNPALTAISFRNVRELMKQAPHFDSVVIDGLPHASQSALDAANVSDVIVIPTKVSLDDLKPNVRFANELVKCGIERDIIAFMLNQTVDSSSQNRQAKEYLSEYFILEGSIKLMPGYVEALDAGKSLAETSYKPLNERVMEVIRSFENRFITGVAV